MIRLLVRTLVALAANAVGLIVAAALLDGVRLNATGFITALVVFTIVSRSCCPSWRASSGGADRLAAFVLPFLGLRKYLEERRV